jgi:hypothetical protein
MTNLKYLVLALGLSAGACKNDSATEANRAAQKAVHRSDDLAKHAVAFGQAAGDFMAARTVRLQVLNLEHGIIAIQPPIFMGLATALPLTDAGRESVNEKFEIFAMRLDEAGNAIKALETSSVETFKDLDDAASKAMERVVDARTAALKAMDDAPRADRSS